MVLEQKIVTLFKAITILKTPYNEQIFTMVFDKLGRSLEPRLFFNAALSASTSTSTSNRNHQPAFLIFFLVIYIYLDIIITGYLNRVLWVLTQIVHDIQPRCRNHRTPCLPTKAMEDGINYHRIRKSNE